MRSRAERRAALVVLTKAPVPGTVKTRLVPLLGAEDAAALHARLLEHMLGTALRARCARVELHGAPHRDPFLLAAAARFGVRLRAQGGGDLGRRMLRALERALRDADYALLVGTDCPALRPQDLRAALKALRCGHDAVLVPTEDGGYALVGLRRASKRLFAGVPWGTARVFDATRRRLARLGWRWAHLRTLWDVDRPEDYARLEREGLLSDPAPRTS
jgi:rSAM/selenodomain-associated transferase 1